MSFSRSPRAHASIITDPDSMLAPNMRVEEFEAASAVKRVATAPYTLASVKSLCKVCERGKLRSANVS